MKLSPLYNDGCMRVCGGYGSSSLRGSLRFIYQEERRVCKISTELHMHLMQKESLT